MPEPKRPLKVFLSYASQDKFLVRELSRRLLGEGWIDTWQDEKNLLPGQDWRIKIEEAVEEADVVIICLSNHSVSKEGHVQKELRYAREIALEKPEDAIFLIPLRLDECDVPRGLRFYQWVDYFGKSKNEAYNALIKALKLRHEQKLMLEKHEISLQEELEYEHKTPKGITQEKEIVKKEEYIFVWPRKIFFSSLFTLLSFIVAGILIGLTWTGFRVFPKYITSFLSASPSPSPLQTPFPSSTAEIDTSVMAPLFINKTVSDGLGSNHVQGVYADGAFIYAATTGGLSISSNGGESFSNVTVDNGLGSDNVIGVYSIGNIVYAATTEGLSISFDGGKTFFNKTIENGLGANKINAVYVFKNNVYAATDLGLSVSDDNGDTFFTKTTSNGLGNNLVYSVYRADNIIYVATLNGLSISFDNGLTFVNKTTDNGLGSNVVYGVYALGEEIYAATESGLSVSYDRGSTFVNFTGSDQFSWVNGVYFAENKIYGATLWFTGLAISKDNGLSFSLYTTDDGLGSNSVYHVYVDNGIVYAATSNGLSFSVLR